MTAMKTTAIVFLAMLAIAGGVSARELQQTFHSGGKCVAHASSSVEKEAKDGFAKAVAVAIVKGCSSKEKHAKHLIKEYVEIYKTCAEATVKVWTSAFADCETYGPNSFGCAAAFAFAKGKIEAYIKLFSAAIAKAENNCNKCDPKAAAEVFASLLVKLTAKAQSLSSAKVCVGPNETASAFAFSKCNAQVIAHGIAFAHAKAAISGGCSYLTADALAEVDNFIKADPYCKCVGWARACKKGKCDWTWDSGKYINGEAKAKFPVAWAFFDAECKAFAKEVA